MGTLQNVGLVGHLVAKYRLSPSPEQIATLLRWEGVLRLVWNLAHEQRLAGLARLGNAKRYVRYQEQAADLTALRAEVPWINAVPCNACQQTLRHLDEAWQDCFQKTKGRPRFKRRGRDAMGIAEPDAKKSWRLTHEDGNPVLRFPKIGAIPVVLHRPMPEGKRGTATITRDVDAWFVSLVVEVGDALTPEDRAVQAQKPAVGIDRGVTHPLADSHGTLTKRPGFLDQGATTMAHLSRALARKEKGSQNRQKARVKLARAHRKIRRQRENFLRTLACRYAKNHGVVVMEDLKVRNMTRSAAGTVEEPGHQVAQKRSLNRAILAIGWSLFRVYVEQACRRFGTRLVLVNPAYSSQECAECHHVDGASRVGERFGCTTCGHRAHADVNAAKVILRRRTDGVEVCGGDGEVRPAKQKPKTVRSRTTSKKDKAKSRVLQGADGLQRIVGAAPERGFEILIARLDGCPEQAQFEGPGVRVFFFGVLAALGDRGPQVPEQLGEPYSLEIPGRLVGKGVAIVKGQQHRPGAPLALACGPQRAPRNRAREARRRRGLVGQREIGLQQVGHALGLDRLIKEKISEVHLIVVGEHPQRVGIEPEFALDIEVLLEQRPERRERAGRGQFLLARGLEERRKAIDLPIQLAFDEGVGVGGLPGRGPQALEPTEHRAVVGKAHDALRQRASVVISINECDRHIFSALS